VFAIGVRELTALGGRASRKDRVTMALAAVDGVYGGFIDKFPMGAVVNRGLTIRAGQCHVQRYMKPLLERMQRSEIDPSFVITHRMSPDDAPRGYELFTSKVDECEKVVLKAA
jgi:threonine dehydrogenase-like Zn-dependent dehydrogenase